ncbi:MAG: SDR family oxidoreductase [Thermoleophilia bacterium]|nr:SDR family oxidoreductase [Thermoleophilia bacterium]
MHGGRCRPVRAGRRGAGGRRRCRRDRGPAVHARREDADQRSPGARRVRGAPPGAQSWAPVPRRARGHLVRVPASPRRVRRARRPAGTCAGHQRRRPIGAVEAGHRGCHRVPAGDPRRRGRLRPGRGVHRRDGRRGDRRLGRHRPVRDARDGGGTRPGVARAPRGGLHGVPRAVRRARPGGPPAGAIRGGGGAVTAVVTGAGTGIGAAIARALAAAGHAVAVTDVDLDAATAVAAEVGGRAYRLDVTDPASAEAACAAAVADLGPLRLWVSNAGVSTMARFTEITTDEWDLNMNVNAKGVFLCGQVAARRFIAQGGGGVIVNTASMAGKRGAAPFLAHYVASKFAVVGLTQAMAAELAPNGVRVNCVCPGYVATGMQSRELEWEARLGGTSVEQVRQFYIDDTPLGRLQTAEDVASAVVFLAGDGASFITGEALAVNGGAFMD